MRCCQPAGAPGSVGSSPRPAVLNQSRLCLGDRDKQDISTALTMWANYIETGSVYNSLEDESKMFLRKSSRDLDEYKKQKIADLRELATKVLSSD